MLIVLEIMIYSICVGDEWIMKTETEFHSSHIEHVHGCSHHNAPLCFPFVSMIYIVVDSMLQCVFHLCMHCCRFKPKNQV